MEFYLILGNTKAMVFNWEGGDLRLNGKGEKITVHKWLNFRNMAYKNRKTDTENALRSCKFLLIIASASKRMQLHTVKGDNIAAAKSI